MDEFSQDFPFDYGLNNSQNGLKNGCDQKFTAVIYTQLETKKTHLSAPIFKLARNVAASNFVDKVILKILSFLALLGHFWTDMG